MCCRNYRGIGHALSSIVKEDGPSGLFRGASATISRGIALSCGLLPPYELSKVALRNELPNLSQPWVNFFASMVGGVCGAALSMPFDFVKTRMQRQKVAADGTRQYYSSMDCVKKVLLNEGPMAFTRGFVPYVIRIAPHGMLALQIMDALNAFLPDY